MEVTIRIPVAEEDVQAYMQQWICSRDEAVESLVWEHVNGNYEFITEN